MEISKTEDLQDGQVQGQKELDICTRLSSTNITNNIRKVSTYFINGSKCFNYLTFKSFSITKHYNIVVKCDGGHGEAFRA